MVLGTPCKHLVASCDRRQIRSFLCMLISSVWYKIWNIFELKANLSDLLQRHEACIIEKERVCTRCFEKKCFSLYMVPGTRF